MQDLSSLQISTSASGSRSVSSVQAGKKQGGTKLYKDADLSAMMSTKNANLTEGQRLNIQDRVLADLSDCGFSRFVFICVGNRQIMVGDLAIKVLVNDLKVGELQFQSDFKMKGMPAKRILISVK